MSFPRHITVERFRERLSEVLDQTRLTRSAFARRAGIDRSTLSQILSRSTDRLPRVETLAAIATTAQVSIDWLVGLSEEGALQTEVLPQVQVEPGGTSPSDARLATWHAEALGYKIRYVPTSVPDLLKTEHVIEHEFRQAANATPEQRVETSQAVLAYQRRPETDMEACCPVQRLESLARGEASWRGLSKEARIAQLDRMLELCEELYPTFRWFLYDALQRYSAPLTIFGPKRAALYVGQMFFVLTSAELIRVLIDHFDGLIRFATVQPTQVPDLLRELRAEIA